MCPWSQISGLINGILLGCQIWEDGSTSRSWCNRTGAGQVSEKTLALGSSVNRDTLLLPQRVPPTYLSLDLARVLVCCPAAIVYERSACRSWVIILTNPAPCYMLL